MCKFYFEEFSFKFLLALLDLFSAGSFQAVDCVFNNFQYCAQLCNTSLCCIVTRLGRMAGMKDSIQLQLMIQALLLLILCRKGSNSGFCPVTESAGQISVLLLSDPCLEWGCFSKEEFGINKYGFLGLNK